MRAFPRLPFLPGPCSLSLSSKRATMLGSSLTHLTGAELPSNSTIEFLSLDCVSPPVWLPLSIHAGDRGRAFPRTHNGTYSPYSHADRYLYYGSRRAQCQCASGRIASSTHHLRFFLYTYMYRERERGAHHLRGLLSPEGGEVGWALSMTARVDEGERERDACSRRREEETPNRAHARDGLFNDVPGRSLSLSHTHSVLNRAIRSFSGKWGCCCCFE